MTKVPQTADQNPSTGEEVAPDAEWLVNRIAHALRNSVFAASLQAELAVAKSGDPAIGKVLTHLKKLEETIAEMLLFGRPAQVNPQDVDPGALLTNLVAGFVSSREEVRPEVSLEVTEPLPAARWDPAAVRIVLERLLKNAVEHTPPPHAVRVSLSRRSKGDAEITVADEGEGIPPDILDRVFLPFFPQTRGRAGLGLAIAGKFARAMGGELTVEPGPERGTVARLRLPVAMPDPGNHLK